MHALRLPSCKEVTAVCLITLPCGGKSTTARGLHSLLPTGSACMADTSDGLDWCLKQDTPLAEKLRAARSNRTSGGLIPDEITIPTTAAYLEHEVIGKNPGSRIVFWSGYPRTIPQVALLAHFRQFVVIYLDVPEHIAEARCLKRFRETLPENRREEDPPTEELLLAKFRDRRMPAFRQHTLPAIQFLKGRMIHVNGMLPLEDQVSEILRGLAEMKSRSIRFASKPIPALDDELYDYACGSHANPHHRFYTEIVAGTRPKPPDQASGRCAAPAAQLHWPMAPAHAHA